MCKQKSGGFGVTTDEHKQQQPAPDPPDERSIRSMDAWIVRRAPASSGRSSPRAVLPPLPPSRQLAPSDCAQLLAVNPSDAADVEHTLVAAGGQVLENNDATVTLVVVGSEAAQSAVDAATNRHPRALVVTPAWVYACVAKAQDSGPLVASSADPDVKCHDQQSLLEEPVRKKARVEVEDEAAVTVPIVAVGPPTLTRAWETVADGALYFLDARTEEEDSDRPQPRKLAAFDLDGTLIVTKSGKRFAQHADDWKLLDATRVAATLTRLAREGFTLVILSNQNGVAKGKTTVRDVQTKMVAVVRKLNVPMLVLFAALDDEMRKPRMGAWRWLLTRLGLDHSDLDTAASLYCGDAAGRPKIAGRNKDFAATDYKFALNAGLQFFTPEALFLQSTQRIHTRPEMWEIDFDPRALPVDGDRLDPPTAELVRATREVVVLVGPPASGKSHLAATFTGYDVVCQDDLKTVAKCAAAAAQALAANKSVVIDCTNRDARARKDWIALAHKHGAAVRCFYMDVPKQLSMHLNTFRKLTTSKDIPDIAIHTFYKNHASPTKEEGFDAIIKVRFRVDSATLSPAHRQLITSFL